MHKAWADFFYERGFYRVDTPIFTPNACEGTTTLFEVDYHGDTAYLAQSGQLYNEADIGALGQVYCFGPTFRAEKSKTRRHLLEFWMLEMEAAYYDFEANMKFQEEMLAYTVKRVLANCLSELRDLERDPEKLEPATETPYPRVRYGEALSLINDQRVNLIEELIRTKPTAKVLIDDDWIQCKDIDVTELLDAWWHGRVRGIMPPAQVITVGENEDRDEAIERIASQVPNPHPFCWGEDFGAPDETTIGSHYDRPVFVTNFPVEIKGFYFKDELEPDGLPKIDEDFVKLQADKPHLITPGTSGHTVLGADLIGPEGAGEMIGGSQREDDYARLVQKIHHHQLPEEFFQWYLDTRRFGNVPHSGFGIGLERFLCWVCGGSDNPVHIREAITFPRMLHQLEP